MDVYKKIEELGIVLPPAPPKGGVYSPAKEFGKNLIYISGCGPIINEPLAGRIGKDFTLEEGQQFAKQSTLNVLSVLQDAIGDLNKVKQVVKILVLVNSSNDFYDQPMVANGSSTLLKEIFGDNGLPTRSAIGVNVLPGNIPVEIEGIFELK
ncbi:MAG: RidA family protein [Lachnospirales bacterium]